ncbi:MAG: OmpA family protein [Elusimicrobia bacterium]|nr:OmpA family protein [Elusimicrobiota bacterium]
MRRLVLPLIAACAVAAAASAALAKPLVTYTDTEDEETRKSSDDEVAVVQEQIDEIQSKIARKEIPPIEFKLGSAVLKESAKLTLELVADLLIRHPEMKLMVFGHTCNIGGREYNRELSQKRADAVKDYLIELGVLGESVRAKGFGMDKPLVPNDTNENRAKNRRVEFLVTNRWWKSIY